MRARTTVRTMLVAALGVALLAPVSGTAQAKPARDLTFMSYNLYLGSSLDPALDVAELPPAAAAGGVRRGGGADLRHRRLHRLPHPR